MTLDEWLRALLPTATALAVVWVREATVERRRRSTLRAALRSSITCVPEKSKAVEVLLFWTVALQSARIVQVELNTMAPSSRLLEELAAIDPKNVRVYTLLTSIAEIHRSTVATAKIALARQLDLSVSQKLTATEDQVATANLEGFLLAVARCTVAMYEIEQRVLAALAESETDREDLRKQKGIVSTAREDLRKWTVLYEARLEAGQRPPKDFIGPVEHIMNAARESAPGRESE